MMIHVKQLGTEKYIEADLAHNLDCLKERNSKGWDTVVYTYGYEGDGKTTFVAQCCAYLDHDFNLDKVVWTGQQFLNLVDNCPDEYGAILLDEAYLSFASAQARTKLVQAVISRLTTIRRKKLYLFITAPLFFEMSKYLIVHRSVASFRIFSQDLTRGYFWAYDKEATKRLYLLGKKYENYFASKPTFRGKFSDWLPFDKAEYERRKEEATKAMFKEQTTPKVITAKDDPNVIRLAIWLRSNNWLKSGGMSAIAQYLHIPRQSFYDKISQIHSEEVAVDGSDGANKIKGAEALSDAPILD